VNLAQLFAASVRRLPGKTALDFAGGPGAAPALTYAELDVAAAAVAATFAARGVGPGDRVALYLGNRPEFVIAYLAAARLGAPAVPINTAYRRRELAHILSDSRPRLIVTEEAHWPTLEELGPEERGGGAEIVTAGQLAGIAANPAAPLSTPAPGGGDLAFLLYTSGTTGRSKGAMLTHDNVLATVAALLTAWSWREDDKLLLALPLFHTHGLVVGLHCALAAGATVLLRRKFDAAEALDTLARGDATVFFGVPTMYARLVEELRRRRGPRLERVRLFASGSAPLPPETFAAFAELTGHRILERYGMTETGMLLSNPYAGERRPGTVGTALPGVEAPGVNAAGAEVPPGAEGELEVRGANVFAGYWGDAEKTAASFTADAEGRRWFRTGDLARRDPADGYFTLLGRRGELIISGGFNIYPREIEEVLEALPGVREAAVVGRPHPEWGEAPVAFVVADRPLSEDEIVAHCKRQLAGFKSPRAVRFVEALPRNALGKVQRHLLPPL